MCDYIYMYMYTRIKEKSYKQIHKCIFKSDALPLMKAYVTTLYPNEYLPLLEYILPV